MKTFDEMLAEATTADITGWDFDWLTGRALEERPPWGYAKLLAWRLAGGRSALDLDTGGGEVLAETPHFPSAMYATEAWPPNVHKAQARLGVRGVQVVECASDTTLPFPDTSFELVTSRHPVHPNWTEIHRVLKPGGHYFAQHVGPASAFELIEYFLGPRPRERRMRDPKDEAAEAQAAGLTIMDVRIARCRMVFYDVGAIIWILRKCAWWVPGFSVGKYYDQLRTLDRRMRDGEPFVAHSTRHLIETRR